MYQAREVRWWCNKGFKGRSLRVDEEARVVFQAMKVARAKDWR